MTHIADGFTVEFHPDGSGVTLAVIGELDLLTADVLSVQLERAIGGFDGEVTVNMAGVTFLDSTALCTLLRAHTALDAVGRSLLLAEPERATTRLLELSGLHDTFRLAPESG